jgi:hypothetical protein
MNTMRWIRWWCARPWRKVARRIESRIQALAHRCMLDVGTDRASGPRSSRSLRSHVAWEYVCLFHHLAKTVILDQLNPERAGEVLARIRGGLVPAWIEYEFRMPGMWPTLRHRRDITELASLRSRSLDTSDELYEYMKLRSASYGTPSPLLVVLDTVGDKAAELGVDFDADENSRRLETCSREIVEFVTTTLGRNLGESRSDAVSRRPGTREAAGTWVVR